jgi:hypothetical protein
MATKAGGSGAAGRRRTKDQAMASMMKRAGIERTSGRCPVCHGIVGNGPGSFFVHSNSGRCLPKKMARRAHAA